MSTAVAVLPKCPRCGAPTPNATYDPGRCLIRGCRCGGGPWADDVCGDCANDLGWPPPVQELTT